VARLTPREREVAALIAQGLSSPRIAEELVISERTADAHADNIRAKLGLHSRAEIAAWATEHGLRGPRARPA
jgi:non-specific serine/threonine protein kinase